MEKNSEYYERELKEISELEFIRVDAEKYIEQFWYEQPKEIKNKIKMAFIAGALSLFTNG